MPLPMVFATATPNPNAATKLKKAAQATAIRGVSTLVDTTVEIELAASFMPLRKSNAKATNTRMMINAIVFFAQFTHPESCSLHAQSNRPHEAWDALGG